MKLFTVISIIIFCVNVFGTDKSDSDTLPTPVPTKQSRIDSSGYESQVVPPAKRAAANNPYSRLTDSGSVDSLFAVEKQKRQLLDSSFFHLQESELRRQYELCTKDSSDPSLEHILRWRDQLSIELNSAKYPILRRQYLSQHSNNTNYYPCEVLNWHRARLKAIDKKESDIQQRASGRIDSILDSAALATHFASLVSSPFDFDGIPFGASAHMVGKYCMRNLGLALEQRASYAFGSDVHIFGERFSIIFFYKGDSLVRYEIESTMTYPSDSLDIVVREQTKHLTDHLQRRIGPPDHLYRIGFFDIKSGLLTPYARWQDNGYTAIVGIVREKNSYFAKARVYRDKDFSLP